MTENARRRCSQCARAIVACMGAVHAGDFAAACRGELAWPEVRERCGRCAERALASAQDYVAAFDCCDPLGTPIPDSSDNSDNSDNSDISAIQDISDARGVAMIHRFSFPMTDLSGGEYIAWQAVGAAQTWIGWHNYSADYSIRRYLRVAYLLHGCLDSGLL